MSSWSLCLIVRDEQDTLGRCLESVAGVFDEIVVADTGSVDATKEVAARFGARVVDFPWIDDFAAARNFAFQHGTSDYLMWLDADDVLLPADRVKLLELKGGLSPTIDAVSMIYNTEFDANGNVLGSLRRFRIVRRDKGFVWQGVVHEDLIAPDGPYLYTDTDIVVTHRTAKGNSGPSRRNLTILENHIAAGRPLRPVDVLNYARELDINTEYAKAIPFYEQYIADESQDLHVRTFALHKLAACYFNTGQPDKEWECTLKSLGMDTPRPEFACRMAERFLARQQFRQAAFWYEIALQAPRGAPNLWSIDSYPFQTWLPHKQLGLCYYQLGDYVQSLQHNQAAQRYLPGDPDIATNIGVLEGILRNAAQAN